MKSRPWRLAALVSHPIQYLVPMFQRLARRSEVDLRVLFMSDIGIRPGFVEGVGETFVWDLPVLEGYQSEFLPNVSPRANTYGFTSKVNPSVFSRLAAFRPDALYLHGYITATEWAAFAWAKLTRVPVLFHGDLVLESHSKRLPAVRNAFRWSVCRGIDAALALSGQSRSFYRHYHFPEARTFWVPLAVDNELWFERAGALATKREEIRTGLGVGQGESLVLYVAVMRPVKRPLDIVQAIERLGEKTKLVMVGGGPSWGEVDEYVRERRLGERVRLVGPKNQSELGPFYAAADVFALCSEHEVNPLVVREAMCFGLPLVLSDRVQSALDFVREGENGFLYPTGSVVDLAERLERVLANPATRARMGTCSRRLIEPWNYDVAADGIIEALGNVAPIE